MTMTWGATASKLSAFAKVLARAISDWQADKPLPPQPAPTAENIIAGCNALMAFLPNLIEFAKNNPGAILAAEDILAFFKAQGLPGAGPLEQAIASSPGIAATAESWIPTLIELISGMQLQPAPLPGEGPRVGRG